MSEAKPEGYPNRTLVLVITCVAAFIMPFSMAGVNIALPKIEESFALNAVMLTWVVTATVLAAGVALVPSGRLADIYGRRKMFIFSAVLMFVSFLAAALAPNYIVLIIARVFQGIGAGMSSATFVAILVSVYPSSERGKVLGINVASVYVGLSIAPVIGGVMTQYLGWRSIFYLCAVLSLVIVLAGMLKIKGEWIEAKGEKFDLLGSIILIIALVAVIYGVTILSTLQGILIFIAGLALFGLFVYVEMRTKSPVVNINLFRQNRVFAFSNISTLLNYMATYAVSMLLSLYLQKIKGLDSVTAGLTLLVQPALQVIVAPLAGRLSDKVKPQMVSAAGMVLTTVALIMFAFLENDTPIIYVIICQIIIGLGFGTFASPNTNAIMGSVDKKYLGIASAVVGTMRTMGQMISQGIIALMFAIFIGQELISPPNYPAFLQSIRLIFFISAAFCFAGIFASLVSSRKQSDKRVV